MSTWALLEDDPLIGRKVYVEMNDKGQFIGARVEQNIDSIIEANDVAEKESYGKRFGDYNRVASVPLTFLEKTGLDEAIDQGDRKYMSKVLNDSDNMKLRTSRGKV